MVRYKLGKLNIIPDTLLKLLTSKLLKPPVDTNKRILDVLYRYILVETLNKVSLLLELS